MAWCPKCRQEYRAGIAVCADCGDALVADLAAHQAAAKAVAAAKSLRIVAPGGTLDALAQGFAARKIPCRPDPQGGALLVPEAAAELIEAGLAQVAEYERVGDVFHVYGPRQDQEPELPRDPKWLELPLATLVADLPAALGGLVAWLAAPGRPAAKAAARLDELTSAGKVDVADVMRWAAMERLHKPLNAWADQLALRPPAGLAVRLVQRAVAGEPGVARALLHVVAKLRDKAAAPLVLPLLDHDDPEVRGEADEVLLSISGIDVGFDADAEPEVRARSVALWREWIGKHGPR